MEESGRSCIVHFLDPKDGYKANEQQPLEASLQHALRSFSDCYSLSGIFDFQIL